MKKKFLVAFSMLAFVTSDQATAGSIGDFFKALGNSMSHPSQKKNRPRDPQTSNKGPKTKEAPPNVDYPPGATATPAPTPTPTVSLPVRVASIPPQTRNAKRDIPYAIPVPNKPGFVTSPFAPKQGLVDVRGFPSGTEVKDPYSGKTFLTP